MGTTTKTGKRQKKTQKRQINFNIFSQELYELVLKDQISNAKNNKNNKENLLFCDINRKIFRKYIDNKYIQKNLSQC